MCTSGSTVTIYNPTSRSTFVLPPNDDNDHLQKEEAPQMKRAGKDLLVLLLDDLVL